MKSIFFAALAVLLAFPLSLSAAEKLNVVIILADDLGWADPGCYGSRYHKTPHIDELARQGMRFTDAYAACHVCSPTRASIMTGKYPARLNLTTFLPGRPDRSDQKLLRPIINQQLPAEELTLPAVLKSAGYVCGHIGKWHLGGKNAGPLQRGFDSNIAGDDAGSPRSYFAPYKSRDGRFMPGLEEAPDGEYLTDRLTTEAEKFIEANRDKPFFLYLAHYTVHIPLAAKADLIAKYKPGRPGEQGNPIYAAMIESLDDSVGRVLKKLNDLNLAGRTLVIFFSDNGGLCVVEGPNTPPTINTPMREGKGYLYEGGIREPFIVRCPGVTQPGSVSHEQVCSIDFMPTILAACGIKSTARVDGIDISPALRGESLPERDLFWHFPHYSNQGGKPGSAIRSGDYKLIEFLENGRRELFNLRNDVSETQNLIARQPQIADGLAKKLSAWRTQVGAKMMTANPNYVPNPQSKDGTISLPARTAEVHGVQLRYEPLPHKNTLGFWTQADDWASWEFTVTTPGKFSVEILQGCGKGQGGSEVELSVGDQKLPFTVEDTGHFQNFKSRDIGSISIDRPGRYLLKVRAKKKAAAAVMDLRTVTLKPTP